MVLSPPHPTRPPTAESLLILWDTSIQIVPKVTRYFRIRYYMQIFYSYLEQWCNFWPIWKECDQLRKTQNNCDIHATLCLLSIKSSDLKEAAPHHSHPRGYYVFVSKQTLLRYVVGVGWGCVHRDLFFFLKEEFCVCLLHCRCLKKLDPFS